MTNNKNEGFEKVIEIFKDVAEECHESIEKILENDPALKEEIEQEVNEIMEARKLKDASQ